MNAIDKGLRTIDAFQELWRRDQWMNALHPLAKLLSSIVYVAVTASFHKYDVIGIAVMGIFPLFSLIAGELSLLDGLYRMRLVLPLVIAVGILNPFFDRNVLFTVGSVAVTGGVVSMVTLMVRGLYTVLAVYVLAATTSVEEICYALRCLHVPNSLVLVVLLMGRYIYMLGTEASRITTAYHLRAPRQRGIHHRAWGALVGQWLMRSMDRAQAVYESMCLRGFKGDFSMKKRRVRPGDLLYPAVWIGIFLLLRFTNLIELLGRSL